MEAEAYTDEVLAMLETVVEQGSPTFTTSPARRGCSRPQQALRMFGRSRELGIPTRTHSDAWASSQGWQTAVAGGALSAEHLTYTPDEEIRAVGADRHGGRAAAPGRARLHDRPPRQRAAVHRHRGAGRHRHRLLLLDPRHLARPPRSRSPRRGSGSRRARRSSARRSTPPTRCAPPPTAARSTRASAAISRSCRSTIPRSCAWPSARTSSPRSSSAARSCTPPRATVPNPATV